MAAMAEASAEGAVLRAMQIPRGFAQERMQYVLFGLYEWRSLLSLLVSSPRPSRYSGTLPFHQFFTSKDKSPFSISSSTFLAFWFLSL